MVLTWLTAALASTALGQMEVQKDGVRLRVEVFASVYTYQITNLATGNITHLEIPYHHSYYFQVPDGWESNTEGGIFRAWTKDPRQGIKPGQTAEFSLRVSSAGAVLGLTSATVGFDSGAKVTLTDVWAPVPEPRWTILLVVLGIVAIVLVHTVLLSRRDRRRSPAGANDA